MIRLALSLALALALLLPAAAAAAVPPALGPDGRVHPLIGGGDEELRDGAVATRVRAVDTGPVVPLAGGDIAVFPFVGPAFAVGDDGRVRMLPSPGDVVDLAPTADGGVLALRDDGGLALLRLAPGGTAWVDEPLPSAIPRSFAARLLVELPTGYAIVGGGRTWRVERGVAVAVTHHRDPHHASVTADGTIVLGYYGDDRLVALPPGGPAVTLRPTGDEPAFWESIFAFPGGGFLRTLRGSVLSAWLTPAGADEADVLAPSGLGAGEGGPVLRSSGEVAAVAPDGAAVLSREPGRLRIAVPPGSARTLASVAPATYAGLPGGAVTVSSTFAGTATVEVRRGGAVVASAAGAVAPGETTLRLTGAPPPGSYTVTLDVSAAGGREAVHRLRVLTLERLPRAAALRARRRFQRETTAGDRDGGQYIDLRRCRRAGARAYSCQAVQVSWQRKPRRNVRRCAGIWIVRLRPDGIRDTLREGPRACRARGPVR